MIPTRRHGRASRRALAAVIIVGAGWAAGCATNPVTGRSQLVLMSEAEEIAMGREADAEISEALGLYEDAALQRYVSEIGLALAAKSERPDLPWTFRVLDDPVVNAFALPGGYIYVTRGILAHLNSEGELAGVLGHEIGHVTARHAVSRLSKAQLLNIGLGVGMIAKPELARFGDLAQVGAGLLMLKYSRDDERQSDELGLRYALAAGYDPREVPAVFDVLQRVSQASGGDRIPGWLSTHPDPGARREGLEARIAGLDEDFDGLRRGRTEHLAALDGVVFGEDPRQGYFEADVFYHPAFAFRWDVPTDWERANQRQAVVAAGPDRDALVRLTLAERDDPGRAVEQFLSQAGVDGGRVQTDRLNELPAAHAGFTAETTNGSFRGRVVCVRLGDRTFQLLGYATSARWSARSRGIDDSLQSFARLTDRKVLDVEPSRLGLVSVARAMTVQEVDREFPSTVPLETVALLNHLEPTDRVEAGSAFKRVVGGLDRR